MSWDYDHLSLCCFLRHVRAEKYRYGVDRATWTRLKTLVICYHVAGSFNQKTRVTSTIPIAFSCMDWTDQLPTAFTLASS